LNYLRIIDSYLSKVLKASFRSSTMRRRYKHFIQVAHDNALKSCMSHKHGCVIVYNNKEIIAQGINQQECEMKKVESIHAEVDAINQLRKMMNGKDKNFIQKCKLYVVRIGSKNMNYPLKESKPCEHCTKVITRIGIPSVYYSTQDEFLKAYEEMYHQKPSMGYSSPNTLRPNSVEQSLRRPICVVS